MSAVRSDGLAPAGHDAGMSLLMSQLSEQNPGTPDCRADWRQVMSDLDLSVPEKRGVYRPGISSVFTSRLPGMSRAEMAWHPRHPRRYKSVIVMTNFILS